jgi:aryl-alcohol dehydrogenase-like predicted oxidoreductase
VTKYHLLGRTGLRVTPLALGTMTFGGPDWGTDEDTSRTIFQRYLDWGGNFVDTAVNYAGGASEELVGKFMAETGTREDLVLATKYSSRIKPDDPNASENGRKNLMRSLETSLRRLRTDYVDLYWLHYWDTMTPVEEVMSTFDALVRSGKVRAVGFSDVPAWYAAKAQTMAAWRGWEPLAALQMEYSLIERNIEREHVPAAKDFGTGLVPWSPLGGGFLTGKYQRGTEGIEGDGRYTRSPYRRFIANDDPKWAIHDALVKIASDAGVSPAQAALNWVSRQPRVTSSIIGATSVRQLEDNLGALDVDLPLDELTAVSKPALHHPYNIFDPDFRKAAPFTTDADVRPQP